MSPELRACLEAVGVADVQRADFWRRVVMVVNHGRVPRPGDEEPMGFKLLILDATGRPEWFARCSWASPDAMRQESALVAVLCGDAIAGQFVPESRTAPRW